MELVQCEKSEECQVTGCGHDVPHERNDGCELPCNKTVQLVKCAAVEAGRLMLTREDYQEALVVQESSSLSAVVHSFNEVISRVWEEACRKGEDAKWVNTHPICRLFARKIADLAVATVAGAGMYYLGYSDDYTYCKRMANGERDQTNDGS